MPARLKPSCWSDGELTEGSSTTVHVVKSGVIHTPPNGHHILPGTTRDVVTELAARLGVPCAKQPRRSKPPCAARTRSGWRFRPAAYCRSPLSTAPRWATANPVRCSSASMPPLRDYTRELAGDAGAMSDATLQEFPSDFPIKVMGRHDSDLRALDPGHHRASCGTLKPIPAYARAPARTEISWR